MQTELLQKLASLYAVPGFNIEKLLNSLNEYATDENNDVSDTAKVIQRDLDNILQRLMEEVQKLAEIKHTTEVLSEDPVWLLMSIIGRDLNCPEINFEKFVKLYGPFYASVRSVARFAMLAYYNTISSGLYILELQKQIQYLDEQMNRLLNVP